MEGGGETDVFRGNRRSFYGCHVTRKRNADRMYVGIPTTGWTTSPPGCVNFEKPWAIFGARSERHERNGTFSQLRYGVSRTEDFNGNERHSRSNRLRLRPERVTKPGGDRDRQTGHCRPRAGADVAITTDGTDPTDHVHEEVRDAMAERGIDIPDRTLREISYEGIMEMDFVITMGCSEDDVCPATWRE